MVSREDSTNGLKRSLLAAGTQLEASQELEGQLNERKIDLINADLEAAMTFADIARGARDDRQKGIRNRNNAHKGYDTVLHYLQTARLSEQGRAEIDRRLGELRKALCDLGEKLPQSPKPVSGRREASRVMEFPTC